MNGVVPEYGVALVVALSQLKYNVVKPVQPLKAPWPIKVTEFGIVIEVSPVQVLKAQSPIVVTELGIDIEISPVQK